MSKFKEGRKTLTRYLQCLFDTKDWRNRRNKRKETKETEGKGVREGIGKTGETEGTAESRKI